MFDRRLLINFDWGYLFIILILSVLGIINLYSASFGFEGAKATIYLKQMYWFGIGAVTMLIVCMIDYRQFEQYAYFIYAIGVILLVAVLLLGKTAGGAQRWINFGVLRLQPSEFMKIAIILALAKYFHKERPIDSYTFRDLFVPLIMIGIPAMLIIKEPDLGTALTLVAISFAVIFFNKVDRKSIVILVLIGLICAPLGWFKLKTYQKKRIITLFSMEKDPTGSGYHSIQSKIAVGSGGFLGKGFKQGTQSQLRFLPEHHTDFIFSVLAEEWGFLGSSIVLLLFMMLLIAGIKISSNSKEKFGALVAFGITFMLFWQIFINVGMVIGMMPVVGITLPLFSYGGSSLITIFIGFGLMLNISMRRFL